MVYNIWIRADAGKTTDEKTIVLRTESVDYSEFELYQQIKASVGNDMYRIPMSSILYIIESNGNTDGASKPPAEVVQKPGMGIPAGSGTFCPVCGAPAPAKAEFCVKCGSALNT